MIPTLTASSIDEPSGDRIIAPSTAISASGDDGGGLSNSPSSEMTGLYCGMGSNGAYGYHHDWTRNLSSVLLQARRYMAHLRIIAEDHAKLQPV